MQMTPLPTETPSVRRAKKGRNLQYQIGIGRSVLSSRTGYRTGGGGGGGGGGEREA